MTVVDKLICQNCSRSLSSGYICNYQAWKWRVMCRDCRWLHKKYERRFMAFQMTSNSLRAEVEALEKIEREEHAAKVYSRPQSVFD